MRKEIGKFKKSKWGGASVYLESGIIRDELFCLDLDKPITIENVENGVLIHQTEEADELPTIMIPGKDKEEAQKKADEEERKMLERQHTDPDFLLCRHGKKEWEGSDPCCAFDEDGNFRANNWNCRLMNRARALMGCGWFGIRDEKAPGHSWWDADHNYGVLYIQSWVNLDQKQPDSYLQGCFILMDWYKSRGKTDSFRILQGDTIREGTEADAQELTRIYSTYLDELYSEEAELYWCYVCNRYHTTTSRIGMKHLNEKSNERSIIFTPEDPDEFITPRSVDPESGEPLEYWCDQCDHFHKTTSEIGMEHMKMWEPGFEYRGRGFIEPREPEPDEEAED